MSPYDSELRDSCDAGTAFELTDCRYTGRIIFLKGGVKGMFWALFIVWSILALFLHYKNCEYHLLGMKPLSSRISISLVVCLVFLTVLMVFYIV